MSDSPTSFLPGPPALSQRVLDALGKQPLYHRSAEFTALLERVRSILRSFTNAARVDVLCGSGTLANDLVAAQLARLPAKGWVASNGEFGRRLIDQASRAGARFAQLEVRETEPITAAHLEAYARDGAQLPAWLWLVHCETSDGTLNDLQGIAAWCAEHGVLLALDAVSSLGQLPIDLSQVALATSVSGKALGSVPGLALVFSNPELLANSQSLSRRKGAQNAADGSASAVPATIPRSLDLQRYLESQGVPSTLPANLVCALEAALLPQSVGGLAARMQRNAQALQRMLVSADHAKLAAVGHADSRAPAILTLEVGAHGKSLCEFLLMRGLAVANHSAYLAERGRIQICTFGDAPAQQVDALCDALREWGALRSDCSGAATHPARA